MAKRPVAAVASTMAQSWDVPVDARQAYDRLFEDCGLTDTGTIWVTYRLMGVCSALGPLATLGQCLLHHYVAVQQTYGDVYLVLSSCRRAYPAGKAVQHEMGHDGPPTLPRWATRRHVSWLG
jgi:hypothetical protein